MRYLIIILFCFPYTVIPQGSGNCQLYNGTSNYTQIADNPLFSSHKNGQLSIEAWIRVEAINTDGHGQSRQPIVAKGYSGNWEWALYVYDNLSIGFSSWQCSGSSHSEVGGGSIVLGQWHHISVSFNDGNFNRVYIDGELVSNGTGFSGNACDSNSPVRIGSRSDGQFLNGYIDEVRIWNKALTQAEIRDNMCKKLIGNEVNLTAYYRIDEVADNTCNATDDVCDATVNAFHGANNNSPIRLYSGAPIGDASAYVYTNSWAGQTVNLSSSNNGNFEVSNVAGTPVGIHVYRVDSPPNSETGIPHGIGSNTTYYGTFVARYPNTGFNMQCTYDYTNFPDAINNENTLLMYARDENSDLSWFNNGSTLNTIANTLTNNSESIRLEYVIALNNGSLPITLSTFTVKLNPQNSIEINWKTESEINNDYFNVEHSIDGQNWNSIQIIKSAKNSSSTLNYSVIDYRPNLSVVNYYRLKQVDFDGKYTYSKIRKIKVLNNSSITIFPNPTNNNITINGSKSELCEIIILNTLGENVTHLTRQINTNKTSLIIDLSNLTSGVFFVKTSTKITKIIKH